MNSDTVENPHIEQLILAEKLPASFVDTVNAIYRPLAGELSRKAVSGAEPLIVGINGAQGTGKSTLTRFLVEILEAEFNLKTAAFSLDDIYLTKQQRLELGERVHPLFVTRGVPGTHDIELGNDVLHSLCRAQPDDVTFIPVFDKAQDDRAPNDRWIRFQGRPSIIIVEGWCVCANPENEESLVQPLNALEEKRDARAIWRRHVNRQLETRYREFFAQFDVLVFIPVPRWELVYQWRLLQEAKLRERCEELGLDDVAVMSSQQIAEFVHYYERVTRHTLNEMGARADYVLTMEEDHRISAISGLGSWPDY